MNVGFMDVGSKITELRTSQNISITDLAKSSGIAQSTLSYIESGKTQPTVETVEKICLTLGITLGEFFADPHEGEPLSLNTRRICKKVAKLSPEKLKVIESIIDTCWSKNE